MDVEQRDRRLRTAHLVVGYAMSRLDRRVPSDTTRARRRFVRYLSCMARKSRQTAITPQDSAASAPRFAGLRSASHRASDRARASSAKRDTKPELMLRRALHSHGLRYRIDVGSLPGRPDVVFPSGRVALFVDGDFWHGRELSRRIERLSTGHNAPYWTAKILANVARDRRHDEYLREQGWTVVRVWEGEVKRDLDRTVEAVLQVVRERRRRDTKRL